MLFEKIRTVISVILAGSIIYFASTILILTKEVSKTRTALFEITTQIQKIESNKNLDRIINETAEVTAQVPAILKEAEAIRKEIPPLLLEIKRSRELVPSILEEVANVRKTIPPILKESEALRMEIPIAIKHAQHLVDSAGELPEAVGSGAVRGTAKGIITAPIHILEDSVEKLTPEEPKID